MAKQIPDVVEVQLQSCKVDRVVLLLQKAITLKERLDPDQDDYGFDPDFHLAREYKEVMGELAAIQQAEGLEGLKSGKMVFALSYMKPRVTVDMDKLKQELVFRGVDPGVVADCVNAAEKIGKEAWKKEVKLLK